MFNPMIPYLRLFMEGYKYRKYRENILIIIINNGEVF